VSFFGFFDHAVVGRVLADEQAKHRRFTGAVRTDQADLLAGIDLERGIDEQDLSAVLLGHLRKRDHDARLYSIVWP